METIECDIQMMREDAQFFFFFFYSFLCRLTIMNMLIYIVVLANYGFLVMFDT